MTLRIAIFGATSAIAHACARRWAGRGAKFVLVGRNPARLADHAADLRVRGAAEVEVVVADLDAPSCFEATVAQCTQLLGGLDIALVAQGVLPDQRHCETSVDATLAALNTNGVHVVALCGVLGNQFAAQGQGTLAVIGSVAGDRGRQSNYVYGAAKGLVERYLQGLRNRLAPLGAQVLTIKPGFVDTPMTAHIQPKGLLWAQPDAVAVRILKAVAQRKDVVYVPGVWRVIMGLIGAIPEGLFKRLKL